MASYFTGEIVGVKRKAPEVITMVNGYPHATYPAFDIVGKLLLRNLPKDKYEVKVNNSNCILRVSDCDIFKIDYAGESEIFDSILLNDTLSQPYIYLGEFADHVLNKRQNKCPGFGGFTQLSKKELKYAEADAKATKEVYDMFNKTPKYSVNDIVIIDKGFSYEYGYSVVVGIINDVYNHRDTGDVFYHIIFNSGTPRKVFEFEIKTKFNTDRFKDGQSIYKQLLVQMYHTRSYKYLTEKEVLEWVDANYFEEIKDEKTTGEELLKLSKECIKYDRERPEILPEYRNIPIGLEQSLNKVHDEMINSLLYSVPTFYMSKDEFKLPTKEEINAMFGVPKFEYKKIIFNGPCTIILWKDGTKTIAKTSSDEGVFDPEKGVAICFMKKVLGHTETNKVLRKASKDFYDKIAKEANKQLDEELRKATFPLPKGVTFRPFTFGKPIDNNKVIKVEKVEEDHKMDFRSCFTCKYASKPVTDKPCSDCASKSRYERGYEK